MKAVVQRVNRARLEAVHGDGRRAEVETGPGLVVLAAVVEGDTERDREWMAEKLANLRIFTDDAGKMNLSVLDVRGEVLLVSNFTVAGDTRKGRRPSFDGAMRPPEAEAAFDALVEAVRARGVPVRTGVFGAHMHVEIHNDGPITLVVDSRA
ncbi:MAG: D-tyrosyl-tRNA(Tyr) deacylase [Phycisphaerales bacterium]|nr:D-tyrosyl-tRNA(Tyr) deacylase [Phycisphaerales bacterium]